MSLPEVLNPGLAVNLATSTIFAANCWPDSRWMHRRTIEKGPLKFEEKVNYSMQSIKNFIYKLLHKNLHSFNDSIEINKIENCASCYSNIFTSIAILLEKQYIFTFPHFHCSADLSQDWVHENVLMKFRSRIYSREMRIFFGCCIKSSNEDYLLSDELYFSLELTTEWLKFSRNNHTNVR